MTALFKPSIADLRQLIGAVDSFSTNTSSFSLYPSGIPKGAVTEIAGSGKTQFIARFLAEHPDYKAAWVEESITINPYALFQKHVNLNNILFIEAQKELPWVLSQALQSGCFKALITNVSFVSEKDLRRYQLLSEKSQAHFFLLSESLHKSWVPKLQLDISFEHDLTINEQKTRGVR